MNTAIIDDPETQDIETPSASSAADFREQMGAALFRISGESPPETPQKAVNDDTSDESDGDSGPQGALTPDPDDDQPTSRRGRGMQRTIADLRAEVDQLKAQIPQAATTTEPDPAPVAAPSSAARDAIADLLGDDAEFERMERTVIAEGLYALENEARYREMKLARMFRDKYDAYADALAAERQDGYRGKFFESLAAHFDAVASRSGIDPEFVRTTPDLGKVFDHIYTAGRNDLADENERLKGELAEAKAQLAGRTRQLSVAGGRSSASSSRDLPDYATATPTELIAAAQRQRARGRR